MGLFKQMKDMKNMVETAPDMIRGTQEMAAQAQQMAAAQQAVAQQAIAGQMAAQPPAGARAAVLDAGALEPVAGVSLELYVEISRGLADYNYDPAMGATVAQAKGVSADDWQASLDGWNDRMREDPAVARRFNQLYTGR